MKRLTFGLITFLITFGFSFSLVGLLFGFPQVNLETRHGDSTAARHIQSVLEQDISYGQPRREIEREYYRLGARDDEAQKKYEDGIKVYVERSSSIDVSRTPEDFQYAWNKHMSEWKKGSAEINSSWAQVLRIADRYGVPMRSRYWR